MPEPLLLFTQKLTVAERFLLRENGINFREIPFIKVTYLDFTVNSAVFKPDYLLIMSQNAVKSLLRYNKDLLRRYPILCVGRKTARFIRRLGGRVWLQADYFADLLKSPRLKNIDNLLILSGNRELPLFSSWLKNAAFNYRKIVSYEISLSPQKITFPYAAVIFFSPSAVVSYLRLNTLLPKPVFCLGSTTKSALPGGLKGIIPAYPGRTATLKLCIAQFKGKEDDQSNYC